MRRWFPALAVVLLLPVPGAPADAVPQDANAEPLFLQVFVNGFDRELIVRVEGRDDALRVDAADLAELGVREELLSGGGLILLRDIPELRYRYDALAQRLELTIGPATLTPQRLGSLREVSPKPRADPGLSMNYALHLQSNHDNAEEVVVRKSGIDGEFSRMPVAPQPDVDRASQQRESTASASSNLRIFGPFGLMTNNAHATVESGHFQYIRDDSYLTWSTLDPLRTYTMGDVISSSLSWTRSVRLGGAQVSRNFDLDPDLITFPVPALGGTAVVPTTVDLYVNGMRQFSGKTSPGPFQIAQTPSLIGAGMVSIAYTDALGREVVTTRPLYIDDRLLERGLTDFSVETGYPRRGYGTDTFSYSDDIATAASWRRGVSRYFTMEAHAEYAATLRNGGVGGLFALGRFGVLSAAVAYSDGEGSGVLTSAGYSYVAPRWSIDLYDRRANSGYRDLGSVEDVPVPPQLSTATFTWSFRRQQSMTLNYTRQKSDEFTGTRIASVGYSVNWPRMHASLYFNAYQDLDDDHSRGGYLGLAFNLRDNSGVHTSVSSTDGEKTYSVGANRQVDSDLGGFGWDAYAEREEDDRRAAARLDYRGRFGDTYLALEGGTRAGDDYTTASLFGTGSIVYMHGQWLAGRPIYDGFALVSTSEQAGVPVLRENRLLGTTNERGFLLVNDLPAYRSSRLAISTLDLPVDMVVERSSAVANPRTQSGVLVEFPLQRVLGATLILVDEAQKPLLPGTRATLNGGEPVLVGYDGQVFFVGLQPSNHISADTDAGPCEVNVPFESSKSMQVIGPFVCRAAAR